MGNLPSQEIAPDVAPAGGDRKTPWKILKKKRLKKRGKLNGNPTKNSIYQY
jgi:hypothetical protein